MGTTGLTKAATRPGRGAGAAALAAVTAAVLLTGCGEQTTGTGASPSGSPTTTSTPDATTTSPTPTLPSPTLTRPGTPNATMSTPPPAKDPVTIPHNPKSYAEAFVRAWVHRDPVALRRLGTADAVREVGGSTVDTMPSLKECEGAAGSTYCTFEGLEYTMTVRVANEKAARAMEQAVSAVKFAH